MVSTALNNNNKKIVHNIFIFTVRTIIDPKAAFWPLSVNIFIVGIDRYV